MTLLCASPYCRIPHRHTTDCTNTDCGGCLHAQAADGLRLCPHCTTNIATHAVRAGSLDGALALALTPTGEPGGRGDHGGLSLSDAAVDARIALRAVLGSWCGLIAEERGIQLPGGWTTVGHQLLPLPTGVQGPLLMVRLRDYRIDLRPFRFGTYIAQHATWLAAHPAAGDAAQELADLQRQATTAAFPSGTRIIHIGICPVVDEETAGQPCGGEIRALLRQEPAWLPSALVCAANEAHAWTPDQWRSLGRHMTQRPVKVGGGP